MVPDGWTGLLLFLLLVAPGLLYDLRARRWRVGYTETAFTEVGRIVLASLAFSAVGVAVAWVAWRLVPGLAVDHGRFALDEGYRLASTGRVVGLAAVSTVVACAAAWGWDAWRQSRARVAGALPALRPDPEWLVAFRRTAPPGTTPFARVALVDGAVWLGWVASYSTTDPHRALVLAAPLAHRPARDAPTANLDAGWQRVVIEGTQISSVAVQYRVRTAAAQGGPDHPPDGSPDDGPAA